MKTIESIIPQVVDILKTYPNIKTLDIIKDMMDIFAEDVDEDFVYLLNYLNNKNPKYFNDEIIGLLD